MGVIVELARAKQKIATLEAELAKYHLPDPPAVLGTISGVELYTVLYTAGLRNINLGSAVWSLTSLAECRRFLKWYRDLEPYILDDYDCNWFALAQMAAAGKWMHGRMVWGMLWGGGIDPEYQFPNHAFNFVLSQDRVVYFCDELEVAASRDDFIEAYEIQSYLTLV